MTLSRPPARSRWIGDTSGQSLVEFAIVVVMLLLLVVGICEFGRAWNIYQIITNAAREGARLAALPAGFTSAGDVQNRITSYLTAGGLNAGQATISIGGAGVDGGTGTQVSIAVSYPYQFVYVGPVIRLINAGATAGGAVTIQTQVVMRNE
jgi:Flp pilus assembly protein TadG